MKRLLFLVVILAFLGTLAGIVRPGRPSADPEFGSWWHDGKAELDGYRLTIQRYGNERHGRAVAIYVTEPFSRTKHVKLDHPEREPDDVEDVLKLNLVRDFQTGIYDYHAIVSLYSSSRSFDPLKTAFSCTEWCGQVYEESNVRGDSLIQRVSSYFEGESGEHRLRIPDGGIQEDQLFVLLRGLRGPFLRPGERRTVPFLASPLIRRLAHRPLRWTSATIERGPRPETIRVPAGAIRCDTYLVRPGDGREGRFDVESAYPHRIVRWSWKSAADGSPLGGTDAGELTGSRRLEYWRTHDPGDERYLEDLGLRPIPR